MRGKKEAFCEVRFSKLGRSGRGLGTWTGAERGFRPNRSALLVALRDEGVKLVLHGLTRSGRTSEVPTQGRAHVRVHPNTALKWPLAAVAILAGIRAAFQASTVQLGIFVATRRKGLRASWE